MYILYYYYIIILLYYDIIYIYICICNIYIYYTIVVGLHLNLCGFITMVKKPRSDHINCPRGSAFSGMGQFHESTSKGAICATSVPLAWSPWQSALCATTSGTRCCVDNFFLVSINGILMGFYGILWWFNVV